MATFFANAGRGWKRLGWLAVIWAASVMALGVVASLFKLLMLAAGMKTH